MTAIIEPFREDGHTCQKCWSEDIRFTFHEGESWGTHHTCAAVAALRTSRPGEHICLTCARCGHRWAMQTADAEDRPPKPAHTCREGVIGSAYGCPACRLGSVTLTDMPLLSGLDSGREAQS